VGASVRGHDEKRSLERCCVAGKGGLHFIVEKEKEKVSAGKHSETDFVLDRARPLQYCTGGSLCYLVHKVPDGRWELWPREAERASGLAAGLSGRRNQKKYKKIRCPTTTR
jgi:hypothetical protein